MTYEKKEKIELLFDTELQSYVLLDKGFTCAICSGKIIDMGIIHKETGLFRKKPMCFYCEACYPMIAFELQGLSAPVRLMKELDIMNEKLKAVQLSVDIGMSKGSISLVEAATTNFAGERIIDRAIVSKDPNRNIMPEYKKAQLEIEQREKEVKKGVNDIDDFFDNVLDSQAIGFDEKPKLEDKSEGIPEPELERYECLKCGNIITTAASPKCSCGSHNFIEVNKLPDSARKSIEGPTKP